MHAPYLALARPGDFSFWAPEALLRAFINVNQRSRKLRVSAPAQRAASELNGRGARVRFIHQTLAM